MDVRDCPRGTERASRPGPGPDGLTISNHSPLSEILRRPALNAASFARAIGSCFGIFPTVVFPLADRIIVNIW